MEWADKLSAAHKAELAAAHKAVNDKTTEIRCVPQHLLLWERQWPDVDGLHMAFFCVFVMSVVFESKLKAANDLRDQERWSYERSLADQAKMAAQNEDHLKAMVGDQTCL